MVIDADIDNRYRCCCGLCKARIGAILVAVFEALVASIFIIFAIIFQTQATSENRRYYHLSAPILYVLGVALFVFVAVLAAGLGFRKVRYARMYCLLASCSC